MFLKRGYLLWSAVALAAWGATAHAGDFIPPAEGPVAFRRDRIPLDAEAIAGLSKNLETLARGIDTVTPAERRCAAQMIALSLALDPSNTKARELIHEFESGDRKPDADPQLLEKSRARVWQLVGWLETPEAGSQGQALAACLKDVIALSDPRNPKSPAIRESGEKGAWAGWIPALSAYDSQAVAANSSSKPEMPSPADPADNPGKLKLAKAHISTLLWKNVEKSDAPVWKLTVGQMEMTATESSEHGGGSDAAFTLRFGQEGDNNPLNQIAGGLRNLLRKRHAKQTAGVTIAIGGPDLQASLQANKRLAVSAAAAVLADSAFTGAEPDALVIGSVDENGALKLPTGFWDQIRSLPKGNGQRLLLPADAASYMPSMLALEHPEFFLEYEVILAADFSQLAALSAKKPEGQPGVAIAEFRTIRERLGSQDVRQYIANSYVKQRFYSVLQDLPSDQSSKLLLVQAAGNRPTTVSRPVLASEIRRALEPMADLLKTSDQQQQLDNSELSRLNQVFEACRSGIDALERYSAKSDAPLITEARDLVNLVRNLEKASRTRGENYVVQSAVTSARSELSRSAKQFADKLAAEIGDPVSTGSR